MNPDPTRSRPARRAEADDIAIFHARCITRAREYAQGETALQCAVDSCQQLAEALGLATLDQDRVQQIMSDIFGPARELVEPRDITRATTDSLEYLIRENDAGRLQSWISKHGKDERMAIVKHLRKRPDHAALEKTDRGCLQAV